VRAPGDGSEKVRAAVAGDSAAAAALWDAHGPAAYAFARRVLDDPGAAADATQDAFLLALQDESGEDFEIALLRATRQTSFELLASGRGGTRPDGPGLAAAAGRLRPQQRAALALSGRPYAEIAAVLGIGVEAVPALLARARLRVHDELHGTALASAAVRSPDCEDVVPLLAAAADGELAGADAAWADPHVLRCPACPRTRRAMVEAAATYAAWSSAAPPSWLRAATLADVGAEAQGIAPVPAAPGPPPRRAPRRAAGAWATPRPSLPVALVGAALLTAAFATMVLAGSGALGPREPVRGGERMPDGAGSVQVATVPAPRTSRPAAHRARTPKRARRGRSKKRTRSVSFTPVAVVHRAPTPSVPPSRQPSHRTPSRPHQPAARPKPARKPRPAPSTPTPPTPTSNPPIPAQPGAPADETPGTTTVAASEQPAAPQTQAPTAAPATSKVSVPTTTPSLPHRSHDDRGGWGDHGAHSQGTGWGSQGRDDRSRGGDCGRGGRHQGR
jgi:DNA-directed RNA polymerase specialized sigma24 family protein